MPLPQTSMVQAEVVNHYQQVLAPLLLSLHLGLYLLKVTRGQHIKAGGREESSQLTWREEGSSLLAWRREDKKDDKESLLSWRRSTLKDGRCHLCRVTGAQRRLRGARCGQEVDQPCSRHAGCIFCARKCLIDPSRSSPPSWWPGWGWLLRGLSSILFSPGLSSHRC